VRHEELLRSYDQLDAAGQYQIQSMIRRLLAQQNQKDDCPPPDDQEVDRYSLFKKPPRLRGLSGLPVWKRRLFKARASRPLVSLPDVLSEKLTQDPEWPINRLIRHTDLGSWICFSTTYLALARTKREDPHDVDKVLIDGISAARFQTVDPWPLARIPQARAAQQSETYRFMTVHPTYGLRSGVAEYPISPLPADRLVVDVTRLRNWFHVLGLDRLTGWALTGGAQTQSPCVLLLRTPYFVAAQELRWLSSKSVC
jgi:hypothetical protein